MTFGEITQTILFEQGNYGKLYNVLHLLHEYYSAVTGISADNTVDKNIFLPTGKAISPGQAASCLLDIQRTAVFIRGVYKAVKQLRTVIDGPVNILYAGCGPYATLLTPLTTQFGPHEVRFHLLDINQESLDAVKALYLQLHAENYIASYICEDAAAYNVDFPVHLIVSECMQRALTKEPQVAVMQNLLPQLHEHGLFVPQEISISAQLVNGDMEVRARLEDGFDPQRIDLGEVYNVGQSDHSGQPPVTISIPAQTGANDELYLFTSVNVFEDERLEPGNCSVTMPFYVSGIDGLRGKELEFKYVVGKDPGFKWKILENSEQ